MSPAGMASSTSDGKDGMGHPGFEVDLAEKRPFFFVVKWDMA